MYEWFDERDLVKTDLGLGVWGKLGVVRRKIELTITLGKYSFERIKYHRLSNTFLAWISLHTLLSQTYEAIIKTPGLR